MKPSWIEITYGLWIYCYASKREKIMKLEELSTFYNHLHIATLGSLDVSTIKLIARRKDKYQIALRKWYKIQNEKELL